MPYIHVGMYLCHTYRQVCMYVEMLSGLEGGTHMLCTAYMQTRDVHMCIYLCVCVCMYCVV
jgi:hypothetical protein